MSAAPINLGRLALAIAERLREIATRQGRVPFKKGDLRKAHIVEPNGRAGAALHVQTPYARAVHDGRPRLVIKPRRARALYWPGARHPVKKITQPARQGRPWLALAIAELEREGLGFLADDFCRQTGQHLRLALKKAGLKITPKP